MMKDDRPRVNMMYVDYAPKRAYKSLQEAVCELTDSDLAGWQGQGAVKLYVGKDAQGVVYYHVEGSIVGINFPAPISREALASLLEKANVPCLYEVKEEIGKCNPRYKDIPNSRVFWDGEDR